MYNIYHKIKSNKYYEWKWSECPDAVFKDCPHLALKKYWEFLNSFNLEVLL